MKACAGEHQKNMETMEPAFETFPQMKADSMMHVPGFGNLAGAGVSRSGGGRRKQSKPIRVFMDLEGGEGENGGSPAPRPPASVEEPAAVAAMEEGPATQEEVEPETSPASKPLVDMQVDEVISCDLCNESFHSQSALTYHIQSVHQISDDCVMDLFPTKYHKLGSEFQQEVGISAADKPEEGLVAVNMDSAMRENGYNSNGDSNVGSSGDPSTNNKSRIFHRDAYCELCDREFCNKYFLKTHKANKHGVYDSPSPVSAVPPSSSGGPLNTNSADSASPLPVAVPTPKPVPQPPQQVVKESTPVKEKPMAPAVPIPAPPPPPPLPPSPLPTQAIAEHSIPSTTPVAKPPSSITSTASSGNLTSGASEKAKPSPDMEDYCDICQKHFCNKYYLKKHKQDVHGIVSDTPIAKRGRSTMSASSGSISPQSKVPPTSGGIAPMMLPQTPIPMSSGVGITNNGAMPGLSSMANFMFINPFTSPVAIIQTQPMLQGASNPPGFHPHSFAALPQMPQALSAAESPGKANIPSSISPTNMSLPGDALRSLSVLTAEAGCEICRKEFVNRYFLNVHKAHKHGIFSDDVPPSSLPLILPGLQGLTPENLSMQGGRPLEPGEKPEKHFPVHIGQGIISPEESRKHSPPEKKSEVEVCDLCKKEFTSKYSLQIHLVNGHNKSLPDFDLRPELLGKAESMSAASGANMTGTTMFSNMIAAKLADRVMCDICNKEVCNKYFLKTHKIKVHGMDPNFIDKEVPVKVVPKSKPVATVLSQPPSPGPQPQPQPKDALVPRPKNEELLKMGIDPEAYCEICKKEFCSKYFLKTHKSNIHGIKESRSQSADIPTTSPVHMVQRATLPPPLPASQPVPIPPMRMEAHLNSSMTGSLASSMVSSLASSMANSVVSSMANSMVGSMANSMVGSMANSMVNSMASSFAGPMNCSSSFSGPMNCSSSFSGPMNCSSSFSGPLNCSVTGSPNQVDMALQKWNEPGACSPSSSQRVMCELCNKELCNKYFMKTHMLNKHGIDIGPMPFPPSNGGGPINLSLQFKDENSNASVASANSNSSSKSSKKEKNGLNLTVPTKQPVEVKLEEQSEDGSNVVLARTWQVPEVKNEPENDLPMEDVEGDPSGQDSLATEDAGKDSNEMIRTTDGEFYVQKCEICGMMFGEKVTLQLHMIRDHQGQVTVRPAAEGPLKMEEVIKCNPPTGNVTSLGLSLKRKYQRSVKRKLSSKLKRLGCGISIGEKVKSAIVNHIQNHQRKKKFRCAHCQERFSSRSHCQLHIRSEHSHIRMVDPNQTSTCPSKDGVSTLYGEPHLLPAPPSSEPDVTDQRQDGQVAASHQTPVDMPARSSITSGLPISYAEVQKKSEAEGPGVNMQAFLLQETPSQGHFANALVYLPVFRKISEPVSVTFSLSPAEQ